MYYPKSQIKTNQYTNGEEYVLEANNKPYIGYYHVIGGSSFYTGKSPADTPNETLIISTTQTNDQKDNLFPLEEIVIQDSQFEAFPDVDLIENNQRYRRLPKSTQSSNRLLPSLNSPLPTQEDYKIGEFQRYFCKRNNQLIYFEIDYQTFNDLSNQSSNIAFDLYFPFSISWALTGNREQVYNTNKKIATLKEKKSFLYGFSLYFKGDFSKYYLDA